MDTRKLQLNQGWLKPYFVLVSIHIIIKTWHTGCPKSHHTIKNLNISLTVRANELIFLSMIEACSKFIFIKTCLERPFVKCHYWSHQKEIYFFTDRKKTIYLTKDFSRHAFMNIKPEGTSILDKKNQLGCRSPSADIQFFFWAKWLLRHFVYCFFPIFIRVEFFFRLIVVLNKGSL